MNIFLVSAEPEASGRLQRALCAAGHAVSSGSLEASLPREVETVVVDAFPETEIAAVLSSVLRRAEHRPTVVVGITSTPAAVRAALAGGADEVYPTGAEQALVLLLMQAAARRSLAAATSERKVAELKLDEARSQLRAIFESTSEAVLVIRRDLTLMTANQKALDGAAFRFGSAPRPGDHLRPWVLDSDWEDFQANCDKAFAGRTVTVQWPFELPTGESSWFEYAFRPVRNESGEIYAIAMSARDISEARRMESELAAREAALTAVFQSMNESLVLMDDELRFILGNPLAHDRAFRYAGQYPVAGGSMEEYVRPEHWRGLRTLHRQALGGKSRTVEIDLVEADGRTTWWEYSYLPVRNNENDVVAVAMVTREITDRKQAEFALKAATAHHRAVIENTTDAIFALEVLESEEGRNFRIAMVNSAFCRLTGFDPERVSGKLVSEWFHPEYLRYVLGRYNQAIEAGETITYDEVLPLGDQPTIQTTMTPVFDEAGKCVQIIGSSRDITERVKLQAEERDARERAERLARIVESANDAILSVDLDSRILSWSPGAERVYGYSAAEAIGQPIELVYLPNPEASSVASSRLGSVLQGASFAGSATKRRHKDGRSLDVLISAFPLRDAGGAIVGAASTATDVTEQLRAEQALREKAADLDAVFSSSLEELVLLDSDARILSINPAAAAAIRDAWRAEPSVGADIRRMVPTAELADFEAHFARAFAGEALEFERNEMTGAEPTNCEISYSPVRLEDGRIRAVLITSRDVTERRRASEALLQAQKLESLGVLAGGIAHDFNNLLVGILGNAGLALSELPPVSPARETLKAIELAGQRAAELARQMLAYSGRGKFVVQDISINDVVEEMTHLLRASIGKGVSLHLHFADNLPLIQADATQLRQVAMNLVVNASDAIGDAEGVISLTTSVVDATPELLANSYMTTELAPGRYVSLIVQDSGSGMDAETLARIFDPFFTTKFAGRGLGLAAVLGIMRSHRGAIWVDSQQGEGTTFRLLLPALASSATEPVRAAAPAPWKGSGLVLVVDDEPTVRTVTARALKAFGFEVIEAGDGVEGLEAFSQRPDEIACVLLDMTMPRMNGEETFIEIKSLRPDARVILMSGYAEQDATERFSGRGLSGFIQKPYELSVLREALRSALEPGS